MFSSSSKYAIHCGSSSSSSSCPSQRWSNMTDLNSPITGMISNTDPWQAHCVAVFCCLGICQDGGSPYHPTIGIIPLYSRHHSSDVTNWGHYNSTNFYDHFGVDKNHDQSWECDGTWRGVYVLFVGPRPFPDFSTGAVCKEKGWDATDTIHVKICQGFRVLWRCHVFCVFAQIVSMHLRYII